MKEVEKKLNVGERKEKKLITFNGENSFLLRKMLATAFEHFTMKGDLAKRN